MVYVMEYTNTLEDAFDILRTTLRQRQHPDVRNAFEHLLSGRSEAEGFFETMQESIGRFGNLKRTPFMVQALSKPCGRWQDTLAVGVKVAHNYALTAGKKETSLHAYVGAGQDPEDPELSLHRYCGLFSPRLYGGYQGNAFDAMLIPEGRGRMVFSIVTDEAVKAISDHERDIAEVLRQLRFKKKI